MTAPDVSLTIQDGGLKLVPETSDGVQVKIGVASAGTPLTLYPFTPSAVPSGLLTSTLGQGPVPDSIAVGFSQVVDGKAPSLIYGFRVTPSTAATSSAVTVTRKSTSTGTVATTGSSPLDTYAPRIRITKTGTTGTGEFVYSLDGGDTESGVIQIPGGGTYAIPNSGVTAVFTPGAGPTFFEEGDVFTWTTTAPAMTIADIATAITALLLLTNKWEFLHIVGVPADHTATAALFAALATHMATLEGTKRYRSAIMEASDSSDANLITAMASSVSSRIVVGAGFGEIFIPTTKQVQKRPISWILAGRASAIPVHEDLARVASGPVIGLVPNTAAPGNGLYRNERVTPGLDSARFSTLSEFEDKDPQGVYVTNAKMFSATGSDFRHWQHRRVMDKACTIVRPILLRLLSDDVRAETEGERKGKILELEALQIEESATAQLYGAMKAHVSDAAVEISRDDNLLSTEELTADITLITLIYFKKITARIRFVNPALQAA
jgi:hypothetical protein